MLRVALRPLRRAERSLRRASGTLHSLYAPQLPPSSDAAIEAAPRKRVVLYEERDPVPYVQAWEWQKQLVLARSSGPRSAPSPPRHPDDALILLEHEPVYTLGQAAKADYLKFDPLRDRHLVLKVERGGEVTFHGPGQLVGYPILDLTQHRKDLQWYSRAVEEVVIRTLSRFGLRGERIHGLTGVWVEKRKLAAVGIKVSNWVTMHGFSLNVDPDLAAFERIVPCGISDLPVGSMAQFIPGVRTDEVRGVVVESFTEVFDAEIIPSLCPTDDAIQRIAIGRR
eukprot:tig00001234_g7728.t1